MKVLKRVQYLSVGVDDAWRFFSDPKNLKIITPPYMGFDITSDSGLREMYRGMIITYKVRPLFNISWNWVTEITQVEPQMYFVDDQKSGPFKYWHHQHFFEPVNGGVKMTDLVNYALPFAPVTGFLERSVVMRRVEEIFDFRRQKLLEMFGVPESHIK